MCYKTCVDVSQGHAGPQPDGGQSGNCPPPKLQKRIYLLGTATSLHYFFENRNHLIFVPHGLGDFVVLLILCFCGDWVSWSDVATNSCRSSKYVALTSQERRRRRSIDVAFIHKHKVNKTSVRNAETRSWQDLALTQKHNCPITAAS